MIPRVVTVGPLAAASANNIALTQTPASAGNLTLNGATVVNGVAILDMARRVLITTAAAENSNTFTITGTDWAGSTISENLTGPNPAGTVYSALSYKTVTSVSISGASSGAITIGTNTIADSPWVRHDGWASPIISVQNVVTGTVNYTLQQTLDDPNGHGGTAVAPASVFWLNSPDPQMANATVSTQDFYQSCPVFSRIVLNSGTGSVRSTFQQSSVNPA